jgi:hypothetical protein
MVLRTVVALAMSVSMVDWFGVDSKSEMTLMEASNSILLGEAAIDGTQ